MNWELFCPSLKIPLCNLTFSSKGKTWKQMKRTKYFVNQYLKTVLQIQKHMTTLSKEIKERLTSLPKTTGIDAICRLVTCQLPFHKCGLQTEPHPLNSTSFLIGNKHFCYLLLDVCATYFYFIYFLIGNQELFYTSRQTNN